VKEYNLFATVKKLLSHKKRVFVNKNLMRVEIGRLQNQST